MNHKYAPDLLLQSSVCGFNLGPHWSFQILLLSPARPCFFSTYSSVWHEQPDADETTMMISLAGLPTPSSLSPRSHQYASAFLENVRCFSHLAGFDKRTTARLHLHHRLFLSWSHLRIRCRLAGGSKTSNWWQLHMLKHPTKEDNTLTVRWPLSHFLFFSTSDCKFTQKRHQIRLERHSAITQSLIEPTWGVRFAAWRQRLLPRVLHPERIRRSEDILVKAETVECNLKMCEEGFLSVSKGLNHTVDNIQSH